LNPKWTTNFVAQITAEIDKRLQHTFDDTPAAGNGKMMHNSRAKSHHHVTRAIVKRQLAFSWWNRGKFLFVWNKCKQLNCGDSDEACVLIEIEIDRLIDGH
jgi:hypothetical protein